jgi:hypothetical protein
MGGVGEFGGGVDERTSTEPGGAADVRDAPRDGQEGVTGIACPDAELVQHLAFDGRAAVEVGHDQVVLRGEVPVEGHLADACRGDQPVRADGPDPLGVEVLVRRREDPFPYR